MRAVRENMKQNIKALEETMAKIRRCEQEVFTTMYSFIFKEAVRRGHLGVYALDSGLRGLVTKCVVFSGKTLDSHSAFLHPHGYRGIVREFRRNAGVTL